MTHHLRHKLAQEVARIVCEEQITDYRTAKQKAAVRLGLDHPISLPDNALVHAAVLEYLRMFGGAAYTLRLLRMRQTAIEAMQRLAAFHPRLVGAVVSGAVTDAHRVQLHAFSEKAEALELFLHNQGVLYEQADHIYHYRGGREIEIPLTCFEVKDIGVDVAIFGDETMRERPLNPLDGQLFKRLDLNEVKTLVREHA